MINVIDDVIQLDMQEKSNWTWNSDGISEGVPYVQIEISREKQALIRMSMYLYTGPKSGNSVGVLYILMNFL